MFRIARAFLIVVVVLATLSVAANLAGMAVSAQSPFPLRVGVVANGTDMALSDARINNDFSELIGDPYSLEGLVLVVDDCNPDPEVYLDQALVHYGMAPRAGAMNNDALAWLVCMDPRYAGMFFASENDFANVLDDDQATDVMLVDLRDENFTGAFTGSIDVVAKQLAASSYMPMDDRDSAGAGSAGAGSAGNGAAGTGAQADEGGSDRNWLAPLLAVVAAGAGLFWWRRRSESAAEVDLPAVPSPVQDLDRKVAELRKRLTAENTSQARLVLANESLGDKVILALNDRHEGMLARLDALVGQADSLKASYEAGAIDTEQAEDLFRVPVAEADALLAYVNGLDAEADHVEMLESRAPVLAVEAREAIAAALQLYTVDMEGLALPAAEAALSFPTSMTDAAEAALTDGQRITAGRLAEDATKIAQRTGTVPATMRELDVSIDEAARLFERFDAYAEASWADIRGNGSEADESLDAAAEMFDRIVAAERDAFGPDTGAGYLASLDEMDGELARAARLIEAVRERLSFLQGARESAPQAIEDVQREIDEGQAWLAQPEVDTDVSEAPATSLASAERLLADARAEAGSPKPDWVAVLRQVNAADQAADEAMAGARAEREQIAARRRQLDTARTEAEAAVNRAERFLGSHRSDATGPSVEQVGEARVALRRADDRARSADELEDRAKADALRDVAAAYEQARALADAAYDALASDVSRADEKRRQYVPRPNWMGPIVPMPMDIRPMPRMGGGSRGSTSRPKRKSSWGSRPKSSGPKIRGKGSSSRRGGGRGW